MENDQGSPESVKFYSFEKKNIFQYVEETYENNLEALFKPTMEALKSNIEEWNQKPEVTEKLEAIKIKNTSLDTIKNVYQLLQDFLGLPRNDADNALPAI